MADVEIKGLRELYIALSTSIPRNMEGKLLQKALAAGTAVTVARARSNIRGQVAENFIGPVNSRFPMNRTGTLRKAIYSARGKTSTPEKEVRIVNVRRGGRAAKRGADAYYARMVEYGHRTTAGKRLIRESTAKTKKGFDRYERKRAAGLIKGEQAKSFVTPRPFMRPAFDATAAAARDRIVEKLREVVEKAVNRARF